MAKRSQKGMSLLLEVVFGIGLFAVALLFLFSLFPSSHQAATQARNRAQANSLARQSLEEELSRGYGSLTTTLGTPAPVSTTVDGTVVSTNFEVDVEVNPLSAPPYDVIQARSVLVTVAWDEGSIHREVRLESIAVQY